MRIIIDTKTNSVHLFTSGGQISAEDHEQAHDLVDELFEKLSHVKDERIDSDAFLDFILLFKNS